MTQRDQIVEAFRLHGSVMTLGEILKFPWGYEFRARATQLRQRGYTILCTRGKTPSENQYQIIEPEINGQRKFA